MAANFVSAFGAADWARLAGLWHDLGKYRGGFQKYIRQTSDPDSHIEGKVGGRDKTHSAAGALHAMQAFASRFGSSGETAARLLAYVIDSDQFLLGCGVELRVHRLPWFAISA